MSSNEDYRILTATWVMSNNDENNLMTYESLRRRLDLKETKRIIELVKSHGELFRHGAQTYVIKEWKADMLEGKRIPSWIRELPKAEQKIQINKLSSLTIFRSQFRSDKNASKASLEVIDWGLRHLERLQTNEKSHNEIRLQSYQLWGTFIFALGSLVLQILIASGVFTSNIIK